MTRRIAPPALLLALMAPVPALAADDESQAWLSESVTMEVDRSTLVTLDSNQRARPAGSDGDQYQLRLSVDRQIAPSVRIGGGMLYGFSDTEREMRLHQQLTVTQGVLSSRTRIEQRFFEDAARAGWRLRQRVQAELPLDRDRDWSLILNGELFFHLNRPRPKDEAGLAMLRNQIGLRRRINDRLAIQLTYLRQQSLRAHRPDSVAHVPWLALNWRF